MFGLLDFFELLETFLFLSFPCVQNKYDVRNQFNRLSYLLFYQLTMHYLHFKFYKISNKFDKKKGKKKT